MAVALDYLAIQAALPVYRQTAELLNADPSLAHQLALDSLLPILTVSTQHPDQYLKANVRQLVEEIYQKRQQSKPKLRLRPPVTAPIALDRWQQLLNDPVTLGPLLTKSELEQVLKWAEQRYYAPTAGDETPFSDQAYDYLKTLYYAQPEWTAVAQPPRIKIRPKVSSDTGRYLPSLSSTTGVGIRRERDTVLPIGLFSLDNLFAGEGQLERWLHTQPAGAEYVISAKLDGVSALYTGSALYTRGDATHGRDITHLIQYLRLPPLPAAVEAVRGELVMNKTTFATKYLGQPGPNGKPRQVNRNSVAGAVGAINDLDVAFLRDLDFVVYELIPSISASISISASTSISLVPAPASNFQHLAQVGFQVANAVLDSALTDSKLQELYLSWTDPSSADYYPYEMDGLVLQPNLPYQRDNTRNPKYGRAWKLGKLSQDVAETTVVRLEWKVSADGLLIPTVVYQPVMIGGVRLERATGHHAKHVLQQGLGVGAKIQVIYWAGVNPRVHKVLVPVKPELPSNLWYDENNLRQPSEPGAPVVSSEQAIQLMLKALNELEVRGFGQQTVTTLHASGVCTKIADYFWVTEAALAQALGSQKIAANLAGQLQAAIQRLTPAHLLTIASAPDGQRAFGRGMGYKKFASLLQQYPNFLQDVLDTETEPSLLTRRIHTKLLPVEGFGPKTLELVLNGLDAFREWFASLPPTIQAAAVAANSTTSPATAPIAVVAVLRKVCVTGLRKDDVSALERAIAPHGGSIQHQVNGSTTMVVRLDEQYTSNKVTAAVAKGLPLLTLAQFREQYLKT